MGHFIFFSKDLRHHTPGTNQLTAKTRPQLDIMDQ